MGAAIRALDTPVLGAASVHVAEVARAREGVSQGIALGAVVNWYLQVVPVFRHLQAQSWGLQVNLACVHRAGGVFIHRIGGDHGSGRSVPKSAVL
jgi:hypothetical protein